MNMASIGIPLFFAAMHISVGNAAFVNVQCKTESVGQYGQNSLLECFVKTKQQISDLQIRMVAWKKEGVKEALLVFYRGRITNQLQGYSFAEPSWNVKNMNVSLLISNTAVKHQGSYTCEVMTSSGGDDPIRTSLKVRAKYSAPTIISKLETITQNTNGTLVCNSDGGYPEGRLCWLDEHNECIESAETEVKQTEKNLFNLSSKLTLQQGSILSKYTCALFNASGGKEEEVLFMQNLHSEVLGQKEKLDPVSKVVAPLLVIGSLIAGLLMALLFYRRRTKCHHQGVRTCESDVEEADHPEMNKKYQDDVA